MNKEEVLFHAGISELGIPSETTNHRCPILVKRASGEVDYAIGDGIGITCDLKAKSRVIEVLEYYPIANKRLEIIEPKIPIVPVELKLEKTDVIHKKVLPKKKRVVKKK